MEHAQRLTAAEQEQYEALLLLRAREKNPEQQALAKSLAGRAMALCPAGEKGLLFRQELLLFWHLSFAQTDAVSAAADIGGQ